MGIHQCVCSDRPNGSAQHGSSMTQSQHFLDSGIVFIDFSSVFGAVGTSESLESNLRSVVVQKMSLHTSSDGGSILRLTCIKILKQSFHLIILEIVFITLETHINVYPINHRLLEQKVTGSLVLQREFKVKDINLATIPDWITRNKFTNVKEKGRALFKYLKSLTNSD